MAMNKPVKRGLCPHDKTIRYGESQTICCSCHALFHFIPAPAPQPRGAIRR